MGEKKVTGDTWMKKNIMPSIEIFLTLLGFAVLATVLVIRTDARSLESEQAIEEVKDDFEEEASVIRGLINDNEGRIDIQEVKQSVDDTRFEYISEQLERLYEAVTGGD